MTAANQEKHAAPVDSPEDRLPDSTVGFGLSAAITILFNTVFAWVKDAYEPLNDAMARLTGHHWITHGLVDVLLLLILGVLFTRLRPGISDRRLAAIISIACMLAGAGLTAWFLVV